MISSDMLPYGKSEFAERLSIAQNRVSDTRRLDLAAARPQALRVLGTGSETPLLLGRHGQRLACAPGGIAPSLWTSVRPHDSCPPSQWPQSP
jgi:hypothetical protein